jgi:hypothetical protein
VPEQSDFQVPPVLKQAWPLVPLAVWKQASWCPLLPLAVALPRRKQVGCPLALAWVGPLRVGQGVFRLGASGASRVGRAPPSGW